MLSLGLRLWGLASTLGWSARLVLSLSLRCLGCCCVGVCFVPCLRLLLVRAHRLASVGRGLRSVGCCVVRWSWWCCLVFLWHCYGGSGCFCVLGLGIGCCRQSVGVFGLRLVLRIQVLGVVLRLSASWCLRCALSALRSHSPFRCFAWWTDGHRIVVAVRWDLGWGLLQTVGFCFAILGRWFQWLQPLICSWTHGCFGVCATVWLHLLS